MNIGDNIHDSAGLVDLINRIGFLPLLDGGISGFSAEEMVDDDCRYGPDLCNYRRSQHAAPEEGSIEETILLTLAEHGSLITRELRALCGFTGPKMRSRFDAYITRLQMGCRIVTEDFVYPRDRHNREYGWGWSLLTTPEQLYGQEACQCEREPIESYRLVLHHLQELHPKATKNQIRRLIE